MLLITAPSKTQHPEVREDKISTIPLLLDKTQQLIARLQQMSYQELAGLLKTSDRLRRSTIAKINAFSLPFTQKNSCPAIFTFKGDSYDAITPHSYSTEELAYCQDHLLILSGLYGLLRPLDLMQSYRLEMGAKLEISGYSNLYQFWKKEVTAELDRLVAGHREKTVVNLASAEYAKVIDTGQLGSAFITIVFRQHHDGRIKTIPIHAKRARGQMIHFAITNRIEAPEKLKEFNSDGYVYSQADSSPASWVFIRQGKSA
ncbi:peroxide stress protein YaaA [Desulforhopalus singaporensis]|uniref:UPF0246 protein SAMN05660330_00336 n=1 Tax=Desulforhopalus singaporensis TaxID=91360 RepID=A0A1H0JV01_9BACT|nr:peroxide stress protein YaaA [Desulforhopalus singaporensis]SDO47556.1 hypothetical protein SAMN05660330_00336 [Desulforhopalus singaporensis]